MKRQLDYELILFRAREASRELEFLLLHIRGMLGEPLCQDERELLYRGELYEAGLQTSLEHAYHHLNFAWNVRYKETKEANNHFDRDEKFPRAFARLWPKSFLKKRSDQKWYNTHRIS